MDIVQPATWAGDLEKLKLFKQMMMTRLNWLRGKNPQATPDHITLEGLRRTGNPLTHERHVAALESTHGFDIGGRQVKFGSNSHHGSSYVDITSIGRIVPWSIEKTLESLCLRCSTTRPH